MNPAKQLENIGESKQATDSTSIDLDSVVLSVGEHAGPEEGMCVMEMVSYMAREPWSDHPACVSSVLGAFLRAWNDALNDEIRQKLKPYAVRAMGTADDGQDEARAWMCVDWLARMYLPAWLDLAGLSEHAEAVRALAAIESTESSSAGQSTLAAAGAAAWAAVRAAAWDAVRAAAWDAAWDAARDAAWDAAGAAVRAAAWAAARDAARDAAWDAAGAAVRAAAWAAARDAARDAAWDAAGAAVRAAAWAAARDAARDALKPTVAKLQVSAFDLLDRMVKQPAASMQLEGNG